MTQSRLIQLNNIRDRKETSETGTEREKERESACVVLFDLLYCTRIFENENIDGNAI